ncbi:DUF4276 family protein [Paenibacillus humicus]|uniref:DUF4276 family protein n=1 Tax=Paenibacillus humicus TaxID=412861 RepID=UPI001C3F9C8F|nr:DUF4276 family protein [Paenibacillus humicus]
MLEEISMKSVLDVILPKLLPSHVAFRTIKHEGKSDLEKSIPIKLRAFQTPNTYFVILRDKDSGDCIKIKENLSALCREAGRPDTLVRIVCHELESWFLGDLEAVGKAFHSEGIEELQNKAKFRDPDRLANPAQELRRLVGKYQKLAGSKAISRYMSFDNNRSHSYMVFLEGLRKLIAKAETKVQSS